MNLQFYKKTDLNKNMLNNLTISNEQTEQMNTTLVPRTICLSISKRNRRCVEILKDYELEYNMTTAATIWRIVDEYYKIKCMETRK